MRDRAVRSEISARPRPTLFSAAITAAESIESRMTLWPMTKGVSDEFELPSTIPTLWALRGTLRNFGLKAGMIATVKFEARINELVENVPDLAVLVESPLLVRRDATRTDRHPAPPFAGHCARR